MTQRIEVDIVNQYGRDVIRPVCDTAKTFCRMLNQKTLTGRDIQHIKELGYGVFVSHQNQGVQL